MVAIATVVVLLGALVGMLARSGSDDAATTSAVGPTSTVVDPAGTTAPTTPTKGLGEGWAPSQRGRTPLRGFGEIQATITDAKGKTCRVCLLAALDEAQRERGLMEVTDQDLGGYDGMVFVYPAPIEGAFWMRDTPMALSIAYFGGGGRLVSTTDMAPCGPTGTCPVYPADGPFRYALEVPKGRLSGLLVDQGSRIVLGGHTCPLATPGP